MRSVRKLLTIFFLAIIIAGCSAIEPDPMGQSEELAKEPLASQSLLLQKEPKARAENKPSKPSRAELLAALYRGERLINFPRLLPALRDDVLEKLSNSRDEIDSEQYSNGIEILQELLERSLSVNERFEVWALIGLARYLQGQLQESIIAWEMALESGTVSRESEKSALRSLHQLYFTQGRLNDAIEVIDRLLILNGELDSDLTHAKAMVLFELEAWEEALRNIEASEAVANKLEQPIKRLWLVHKYGVLTELLYKERAANVLSQLKDLFPEDNFNELNTLRPGQMRILAGHQVDEKRPIPISHTPPVYPLEAIENNMVGWVMLLFMVTGKGMVEDPVVVDNCAIILKEDKTLCENMPNNIFDQAAIEAIKKSRYRPVMLGGAAVPSQAVARVEFY